MSLDRSWAPPEPPLGVLPFLGALVVALLAVLSVRIAEDVSKRPSGPPPVASGDSLLPPELAEVEPQVDVAPPPAAELRLSGPEVVAPGAPAEFHLSARSTVSRPVRLVLPTTVTASSCGSPLPVTFAESGKTTVLQPKDDQLLATIFLPPMTCGRGFGWGILRADVEVAWTDGGWANVQPLTATWQVREAKK